MNPNKIYNRILDFLGFCGTVLFILSKMLEWTNRSWWWILFPIFLPSVFHVDESNTDESEENNSNTLKMA